MYMDATGKLRRDWRLNGWLRIRYADGIRACGLSDRIVHPRWRRWYLRGRAGMQVCWMKFERGGRASWNDAACRSQYVPSDRFGHSGYLHGLFGFLGIFSPPF